MNHYEGRSISFDLDGTLCDDEYPAIGKPHFEMVAFANVLNEQGWWIVVSSSRPQAEHPVVEAWLREHQVRYDQIVLGAKPNVDVHVDDRGLLPPLHALDALLDFTQYQVDERQVLTLLAEGALESSWAAEQLEVPENPEASAMFHVEREDGYRVVVPVTGGLDSTTLWLLAREAGLPVEAVYVRVGAPYERKELDALDRIGIEATVIDGASGKLRFGHILVGRNANIIFAIAAMMRERGWWGQLWFGNLAGESPAVGGDKSARFLATTQHLLTLRGYDVQLCSPLGALDKPDLVRLGQEHAWLDHLVLTVSCFDGERALSCGQCQACFRRVVAFEAAGIDTYNWFAHEDWSTHVAKYEPLMRLALSTGDFSHYSPARCTDTLAVIARLREQGRL